MTNKLIIKDEWYLKFNERSLFDWDVVTVSQMLSGLYDRGIVTGNEVRDRVGYDPKEGLDDLKVLENYINIDRIDDQKKLKQNGE
jgi:hypothetical protein